ncbi:glycoside hydrolase family 3 N-terminal domain-containing protein [Pontibacter sp. G13]|uniref:glycoside hydrolase family 3 N-terminal domain-containing protein n=1 Tax=Pontibacter sp. G13 TaxID=3074898 RepID=UPI00288A4043|nr:glycoside hydrolase family 3 N-terminal domain-containing protein [Pontibacter sp. G13]WNJ16912.1 glycoside hydrolase family 3 N-terminal domain-containing protein [Pontibacter sp. G13]
MRVFYRLLGGVLLALISCSAVSAQSPARSERVPVWVDSLLNRMTLEEKVGQLFMVATFSNLQEAEYAQIDRLIRDQHIGGLIFMQGTPEAQLKLNNRYQREATVPLLIAQDAEWGLSMRLKNSPKYPKNMTLGAIKNDSLIYQMGSEMGKDLKRVGVTLNFAPVVDINNNPLNPVINYRSFGENKYNVARKGIMLMKGMQDEGVIACAKHFPGHGDTDVDSHYDLPVINHDQKRLDTLELYPFMRLVQSGIQSVMVGHLHVPALDDTPNQPTTLSPKVVNGLLRDSMNFQGLTITDALNMHGVAKFYGPGEVSLKAFKAGNDILLFPSSIPRSARLIREAILSGEISEADLNTRVRRILTAKYRVGLDHYVDLPANGLQEDLFRQSGKELRENLYQAAITLPKNEHNLVPFRNLDVKRIAYLQIGGTQGGTFDRTIRKYAEVERLYLPAKFTEAQKQQVLKKIGDANTVIVGLFGMKSRASQNYGISPQTVKLMEELAETDVKMVLSVFGSPYALKYFGKVPSVLVAYESVPDAQKAAATALFGGAAISGRLPVTASTVFREGMGIQVADAQRFQISDPEDMGMDSRMLNRIDSIANHYIDKRAMPGCEILVMRKNHIVYAKGFGKTTFTGGGEPIDPEYHTYDLASITKVAATTLSTMYLVEQGMLDLDKPISRYLPDLKRTNKANLTVRRLLQHNAGLPGWIPFHMDTYEDDRKKRLNPEYYAYSASRSNEYSIAPGLFGTASLQDFVWQKVKDADVRKTKSVRYSDVGMVLLGKVIEAIVHKPLDEFASETFYQPLGMDHTCFNPALKGRAAACPPTEADTIWRNTIVKGYVHDPASAIMGGVAGHAGLFANIYDMAKLSCMLQQGGTYGGQHYLNAETIRYFTRKQLSYSRKGLGWDKPETRSNRTSPVSQYASPLTFGHTGFTGTCWWMDPTNEVTFIFLSNRTFPYASNRKLLRENVRTKMMDVVYESIFQYQKRQGLQP